MVRLITGDPIGISGVNYLCVAIRSLSSCQTGNMAALLNSLFFLFKISFLLNYRVIYYDYCKVVEWDVMEFVCIAGYVLNLSLKQTMTVTAKGAK